MIKKSILYTIICALFIVSCNTESSKGQYDTRAIASLDELTKTIGELSSCSYTLNSIDSRKDSVEIINQHDVYMGGPNKMYIHTVGTKGEKSYWYNGKNLAYFNYNKNAYDTVSAPNNIIKAIDLIHDKYQIDFPAADFFYPTLTDDILEDFSSVLFEGDMVIDDITCVLIEASNDVETLQIWIAKDTNLPHRMVLASKTNTNEFYDVVFSNWKINQELPDLLFEFEPPTNSKRIHL